VTASHPLPSHPLPSRPLTARQLQILELIAEGATKSQAADALGVTEPTVKSHVAHILDTLGTRNAAHAVAIAYCRGMLDCGRRVVPQDSISTRERQVLAGIAFGMTDSQVGHVLGIAPATVKSHLRRIYTKLGVSRRAQAVDIAFRSGLLVVKANPPRRGYPERATAGSAPSRPVHRRLEAYRG
jgi:DNA-binding CsgD family transcriptional regulator